MGYQGGRHYGGYDRNRGDWDRGSDRHRGQRDWRDDRSYRYGTRGQFSGPDARRTPEDYDPDERGFFDRAGDEIRSWFGDEEAERRREYDDYYNRPYGDPRDESSRIGFASASRTNQYLPNRGYAPFTGERSGYGSEDHGNRIRSFGPAHDYSEHHDANYYAWRQQRIEELDRDYAEYQRENRDRFNNEFGSWRSRRTEQRQAVQQVREHMEVVGSDGEHVGTVDHLKGDRIILTKTDQDAGGVHHSVPSSWIKSVDAQRVTLEKTADQAHAAWRTEGEQNALFGERREDGSGTGASGSGSLTNPASGNNRYR
ncbi:hypothetical protein BV98_000312 [Sphingobium herbicidovorans NBRC 16415]|uniref:SWFGD domain-containing protein n=1 Tax=Sphingobium herbicidovorans (strain ATCC 700291 / DSM 11019 / CCUG 56400 / KCTC 2939 / LMG 18315 / NBRC 16415 / MH) TaxID=1219045 RepID=A0A086PF93_SPHHM|nr:DUF2171 domain-containing protein [Sphingobium herbicidovorans]KFG92061.1 hypothetical protein BV98_000312 [Sphingobium herbicidovorans NBRC 16415]